MSRSRIVIAGGGLAGHRIAYALQHQADVTVIDPKDYFEVPMAAPRMLVEPSRSAQAIIPLGDFLPGVRHLRSRALSVQPDRVTTSEGDVSFDYLVLATGSAYNDDLLKPHKGDAATRREHYRIRAAELREAKRILIVGGGPVGVELAGEIVQDYPDKRLTLIHSEGVLLPSLTPGPQRYALDFLRRRNVEVHLNRRATPADTADADMTIWCTGYRIDTSYLEGFAGDVRTPDGHLKVDEHLRLAGTSHIFVAGDITALPEPKLGIWAGKHAAVVIRNLRCLLRGKGRPAIYRPATGNRMMLVTLGRNHGTGHLPFGDFSNAWLARTLKSRDMFIGRYRKGVGLTAN